MAKSAPRGVSLSVYSVSSVVVAAFKPDGVNHGIRGIHGMWDYR
jgi:hypothetical protein